MRAGDTLVVLKLNRLAHSVPDARAIGDSLVTRGVKLRVGTMIYDPADPMGGPGLPIVDDQWAIGS